MKNTLLIKLWLTLIAFGAALGMSAQYIDNLSKIESGKYYRIVNVERGEALAAIDGTNAVKQMPVTLGDRFQRWQITYDETSKLYTLYNEGRKMYLAKPANNNNGTAITTGTTAGKYTIRKTTVTTKEPTYFNILPQGTTTNALNNYGGNTADGSVKLYTANAGGEWQIAPFDDAEFAEADMFKRGIFRIRNKRINSKYLAENTSTHKLVGEGKKATSSGDYSQIWLLAPRTEGGYTIYNMATGRKVTHAKNNEQFGTSDVTGDPFYFLKVAVSGGKTYWNITVAASFDKPTDQVGLNLVQSNSNVVGWQDDPGSQWELELINDDEITIQKARESVLNATKAPQIEDGKYYYFRNMLYGTVMRENFGTAASGVVYTADRHVNDYAEVWRAVKDENGYKLQNIASGRYVMRAASKNAPYRTGADDKAFTFTTEENSEYRYERAYNFKHETTTTGMSCNNAGNVVRAEISNDGPNNAGSEWGLESIEISEAQLAEAKVQYEEYLDILQNAGSYIKAVETFFADKACTDLKDEYKNMTDEQLKAAIGTTLNSKLTDMVLKIKNDKWASYTSGKNWEKRFRVQEYGAFSNREAMGQKLRLNPWSSMNGPTGITSGNSSSPIYVFVDEFTMPSGGKLYAEFIEGANINNPLNAITLKAGLNILTNEVPNVPLFITYETKAHDPIAKYTPIKIHIEGGDINGYFDTRDQSDEDWVDMWNDGLFTKSYAIDVVGKFAQWHMNAQKVKAALNNKPVEVMQIWDRIVELQVNLMGVHKSDVFDDPEENLYPSVYNNRMAGVSATKNYMWSQNGGTFYEEGTIASVLNYENMNGTGALWGPAHEIGHNNQAVIKLAGTTEVSNNLFSNMVVYEFGKITTRYWNIVDRQKGMHLAWPEYYARGREVGVGEPIASMNRMFFTLYLYYHVLGNKPDFYQQVFKSLRHDPIVNYGGGEGNETITNANTDYLKFAKVVCDVAQEDLTEYFDYWGFLKPCDEKIGDYANFRMVNTDAQIKEFRDYIKSKGYRKNGNILFLDDRAEVSYQADGKTPKGAMEGYTVQSSANKMGTFTAFKANAVPTGYSATVGQTTGTVTIKAGTGAVGYKIYDADGNLVYVATTNTFAIPNTVTDKAGVCIVAAAADPANDVVIYGELAGIDNVSIDTNEGEQVIYDLSGRRVQKAQSGLYIINGKKVLVK